MRIRIKWILTGLAALVVGVVVTVYAVLATMDFDDLRAVIEAKAKSATGRTLSIAGPVDLRVSLTPAIAIENVTVGNAPWGAWPEMLSIRRLEVEVRLLPLLSGEIEVRRLVVVEPTILLETSGDGLGNWVIPGADGGSPAGAGEEGPSTIPSFHRIEVRDGQMLYRDGRTGEELRIDISELQAKAESPASPAEVTLEGSYNGVAFEASGTLGSRDRFLSGGRFPLDLKVDAAGTVFTLAGEIAEPAAGRGLDLQVEVRGDRLSDLSRLTETDLPALGPYALATRLADTEAGYKLSGLALTLGGSDVAGNATVSFAGAIPMVTGTLAAGLIDLDDFRPSDEARPGASSAAPSGAGGGTAPRYVLSEDPLPLGNLKAVDGRVKLTSEQLKLDDRTMLSEVSFVLDLKRGRLTLNEFAAGFSGGRLSGDLTLDAGARTPPMTLDLEAKGFDYGHFLQGRDVTDGVSGTLDAHARLSGAGASLRAWASSLSGRVDLVGGEGRVRSDLLRASGAGLIDMVSAWREADDDLRLNCVVMRLPVESGVVSGEAVLIDTAAATVGVSGTLDLRDETLDLKVTPQAKHASLMSLMVPVRVGGTLAEPSVGPDALGTAVGVAKIAGMFINPLVAGAALILDSELSAQNPCVAALQESGPGAEPEHKTAPTATERAIEGAGGALKDAGEGLSRGLRSIFND